MTYITGSCDGRHNGERTLSQNGLPGGGLLPLPLPLPLTGFADAEHVLPSVARTHLLAGVVRSQGVTGVAVGLISAQLFAPAELGGMHEGHAGPLSPHRPLRRTEDTQKNGRPACQEDG